MSALVEMERVSKSFYDPDEIPILKNACFSSNASQSVAIIGPSGSGKSTFLHLLGGIEFPDSGSIMISGKKVSRDSAPKILNQQIGYVFQSFHLLEESTALENVLMPAMIARKNTRKGSAAYTRAVELLEYVGLSERIHSGSKHLSGGEKQRVAIARALCNNPSIILADEPTGNLDPHHAEEIQELLLSIAKKEGKAVIIVTHNHIFAHRCDMVLQLENGHLCTLS